MHKKNDIIMNNLLFQQHYFTSGWKWGLAFILQTSRLYYVQVLTVPPKNKNFDKHTVILLSQTPAANQFAPPNNSLEAHPTLMATNWHQRYLEYLPLKKSTSWKNKLHFTLNLLLEPVAGPGISPFFLSINIWRPI